MKMMLVSWYTVELQPLVLNKLLIEVNGTCCSLLKFYREQHNHLFFIDKFRDSMTCDEQLETHSVSLRGGCQ